MRDILRLPDIDFSKFEIKGEVVIRKSEMIMHDVYYTSKFFLK